MMNRKCQLLTLAAAAIIATPIVGTANDRLYYEIGGAAPISASAGMGHSPRLASSGVKWNINATCGNFDMGSTVSNQLNGVTDGFQELMSDVIDNATGAIASLPAMIIQRSNPGVYDLATNGVMQGRVDFDKSKLSCRRMAEVLAEKTMGGEMQQGAMAENWKNIAANNSDAVAAESQAESAGGNAGRTWIGGQKRGGAGQEPIRVVEDAAKAGYNMLYGRDDPTSNAPIDGGGTGWGASSSSEGDWVGGGAVPGKSASGGWGDCHGGMCTIWSSPADAADWTKKIVGDTELRTCNDCEKSKSIAGTGLIIELESEQKTITTLLTELMNGGEISQNQLDAISAGSGLSISRSVIESMRSDPQGSLLAYRLANEMALARTLTKAMWARRTLIAGSSAPGIEDNETGVNILNQKLEHLDRDIEQLQREMSIRKSLASNAARLALERAERRAAASTTNETSQPRSRLDGYGAPIPTEE